MCDPSSRIIIGNNGPSDCKSNKESTSKMLKHLPPPNPGPRPGRAVRPQQPLNVSALSAGSVVGSTPTSQQPLPLPLPLPPMNHLKTPLANGGPRLSSSMLNTPLTSVSSSTNLLEKPEKKVTGAKEALTSLGLLCLGELLLVLSLRIVLTRSLTLFPLQSRCY